MHKDAFADLYSNGENQGTAHKVVGQVNPREDADADNMDWSVTCDDAFGSSAIRAQSLGCGYKFDLHDAVKQEYWPAFGKQKSTNPDLVYNPHHWDSNDETNLLGDGAQACTFHFKGRRTKGYPSTTGMNICAQLKEKFV
jgi:hypothetical protein